MTDVQTTPGGIRLYGNLTAEDDYCHPLGPEENFNESVYFNFFDRERQQGGFLRLGNRANEGYAEMTVMLWNPDGSALFTYAKPEIRHNDAWHAGGASVEILTPAERVRTRYQGKAVYLADPRAMAEPGRAFRDNPQQTLDIDLQHDAVGPMYGHVGSPDDDNQFARAHTEQHMRVGGRIAIGDDAFDFNGFGLRDHSWGPRYWQATPSYRWITANFGADLGMILRTNGQGEGGGLFHQGQDLVRIKQATLDTTYEPGTRYHQALRAVLTLEDGRERVLEGRVLSFIPLRNRRAGSNTHVGEGMTEYRLDGNRVGYGLSEYLDQPEQ